MKSILFCFLLVGIACAQENRGLTVRMTDVSNGEAVRVKLYGGSYALVIGNGEYENWADLSAVAEETTNVMEALKAQGFSIHGDKVWRNLDEDSLTDVFEDFIDEYGYDEANRLVFYFAGHGHTIDKEEGFLVPVDAESPSDERAFRRTSIDMGLVQSWMKRLKAKHALFLFDCCFAGSVFSTRSSTDVVPPKTISTITGLPVRKIITAGSANEPVPSRSVFSRALVDALQRPVADYNKDGYVTGTELSIYLRDEVARFTTPANTVQFGTIKDRELSQGDVVFQVFGSVPQDVAAKPMEKAPEEVVKRRLEEPWGLYVIENYEKDYSTKEKQWEAFPLSFFMSHIPKLQEEKSISPLAWDPVPFHLVNINVLNSYDPKVYEVSYMDPESSTHRTALVAVELEPGFFAPTLAYMGDRNYSAHSELQIRWSEEGLLRLHAGNYMISREPSSDFFYGVTAKTGEFDFVAWISKSGDVLDGDGARLEALQKSVE